MVVSVDGQFNGQVECGVLAKRVATKMGAFNNVSLLNKLMRGWIGTGSDALVSFSSF
jgi:hypothetical protein